MPIFENCEFEIWTIKINKLHLIFFGIVFIYLIYLFFRKLRRISYISDLPNNLENFTLNGIVTHVGDGDGFKLFHIPMFRSSKYTKNSPKLKIRLAGIDAPEVRYYNIKAQEHAKESQDFLKSLIYKKKIKVEVLGIDMYNRILGFAFVKTGWFRWKNVNIEMIKNGMACVYSEKNAIYGKYKNELFKYSKNAQKNRIGMWRCDNLVLPSTYKRNHR